MRIWTRTAAAWVAVVVSSMLLSATPQVWGQSVPVTVRITELVQLDPNVDPEPGSSLGDMFAEVTINGTAQRNYDDRCNNPFDFSGFVIPFRHFVEGFEGAVSAGNCKNVPWTFMEFVPIEDFFPAGPAEDGGGIPISIKIIDDDSGPFNDDDTQDANPIEGKRVVDLTLRLDGTWSGDFDYPRNCTWEPPYDFGGRRVRICWSFEVGQDSDGDGLLDDWELYGLDVDGDGIIDLDLPGFGADPMHKDLFVELDWSAAHPPSARSVRTWKEAFAAAPIDAGGTPNPDGLPGINLWVDTGGLVDPLAAEDGIGPCNDGVDNGGDGVADGADPDCIVGDDFGGGNQIAAAFLCGVDDPNFYVEKAANFDEATRSLVFRYGITATQDPDGSCPRARGGQGEIGGDDFICFNRDSGIGDSEAACLMHELGHNLNLQHGGANSTNFKPNYLSVMNYDNSSGLVRLQDGVAVYFQDYSPPRQSDGTRGTAPLPLSGTPGVLDEDGALDEINPMDLGDGETLTTYVPQALCVGGPLEGEICPSDAFCNPGAGGSCPVPLERQSLVNVGIDWDDDPATARTDVTANVNRRDRTVQDQVFGQLAGFDDWYNISLPFLQFGDSLDGPINPVEGGLPTDAEIAAAIRERNTTDLAAAKSADPEVLEAGAEARIAYTVTVDNLGPNPAYVVDVTDTLPAGLSAVSVPAACSVTGSTVSCSLNALLAGASAEIDIAGSATGVCVNGLPVDIANTAAVANGFALAGPDLDPSNNAATAVTDVVDTTPPELEVAVSPDTLWAPDHKLVTVDVTLTATDVCDDDVDVRLVSITSNEADNALADGNTDRDIRGAAFGTDDRSFELRAERQGSGDDRVYTIVYDATDASGNATRREATVTVPRDQGM